MQSRYHLLGEMHKVEIFKPLLAEPGIWTRIHLAGCEREVQCKSKSTGRCALALLRAWLPLGGLHSIGLLLHESLPGVCVKAGATENFNVLKGEWASSPDRLFRD